MLIKCVLVCFLVVLIEAASAQEYRWQQRVEYTMDVSLDVNTHRLNGRQHLIYHNNSGDTLSRLYYHLYFNAFQPGSMMDMRSRTVADPDPRIRDRIAKLHESEIGYQRIKSLLQDGHPTTFLVNGTLLEVILPRPVLPHTKTTLVMEFEAQVPVQIRRSGRNNKEGIAYSMTQWYPKLAEYDFTGWHINPYVAREFHGVWGDFNVTITIDPDFTVAGTGVLQNPDLAGHGYESAGTKTKRRREAITWNFVARNVHDFAWAADPDYKHVKTTVPGGPEIHFFYQDNGKTKAWDDLPGITVKFFQFMNTTIGNYPYETYSVIQGGDGGMEYPMCTLIVGEGKPASTISTVFHEVAHSWFQGVLASNEAAYGWMDEGFAQFIQAEAKATLMGDTQPFAKIYSDYTRMATAGEEEPMSQYSDHFVTNDAYKIAAYYKGCILLNQLRYIIGEKKFWQGMRSYYETWKFRHPEPIDFVRIMEKISGMQLKWYFNNWIHTTKQIDYTVMGMEVTADSSLVRLVRKGELAMPVDLLVTYHDGSSETFYIPLNETFGSKEPVSGSWIECRPWSWVNPRYDLVINHRGKRIVSLEIDPSKRMADVNPDDNIFGSAPRP